MPRRVQMLFSDQPNLERMQSFCELFALGTCHIGVKLHCSEGQPLRSLSMPTRAGASMRLLNSSWMLHSVTLQIVARGREIAAAQLLVDRHQIEIGFGKGLGDVERTLRARCRPMCCSRRASSARASASPARRSRPEPDSGRIPKARAPAAHRAARFGRFHMAAARPRPVRRPWRARADRPASAIARPRPGTPAPRTSTLA